MGQELKFGSLYNPLNLGLEAAMTSKTLFTFFPFKLKPNLPKPCFHFFIELMS